jgi:DNA-binding response OmpR family regulator
MRITVASSNIFRRELTCYMLAEAGYAVDETLHLPGLLESLAAGPPLAIVVDTQLGCEPGHALEAVRLRSQAPILWIAEPPLARPLLMLDKRPADAIAWPYDAAELIERVVLLIGRAAADLHVDAERARYAGSSE